MKQRTDLYLYSDTDSEDLDTANSIFVEGPSQKVDTEYYYSDSDQEPERYYSDLDTEEYDSLDTKIFSSPSISTIAVEANQAADEPGEGQRTRSSGRKKAVTLAKLGTSPEWYNSLTS